MTEEMSAHERNVNIAGSRPLTFLEETDEKTVEPEGRIIIRKETLISDVNLNKPIRCIVRSNNARRRNARGENLQSGTGKRKYGRACV